MADQINVSPGGGTPVTTERVIDRTDGGSSGWVWVLVILLILLIAFFAFGRDDNDGTDNTPNTNNTTEQNSGTTGDDTDNSGSNPAPSTDDDGTPDQGSGDR